MAGMANPAGITLTFSPVAKHFVTCSSVLVSCSRSDKSMKTSFSK